MDEGVLERVRNIVVPLPHREIIEFDGVVLRRRVEERGEDDPDDTDHHPGHLERASLRADGRRRMRGEQVTKKTVRRIRTKCPNHGS